MVKFSRPEWDELKMAKSRPHLEYFATYKSNISTRGSFSDVPYILPMAQYNSTTDTQTASILSRKESICIRIASPKGKRAWMVET